MDLGSPGAPTTHRQGVVIQIAAAAAALIIASWIIHRMAEVEWSASSLVSDVGSLSLAQMILLLPVAWITWRVLAKVGYGVSNSIQSGDTATRLVVTLVVTISLLGGLVVLLTTVD